MTYMYMYLHQLAQNCSLPQVLHNLSVWTAASRSLSYNDAKSSAQNAKKEMKQVRPVNDQN